MRGACFAAGLISRKGYFHGGRRTRVDTVVTEDWHKLSGLQKSTVGLLLKVSYSSKTLIISP